MHRLPDEVMLMIFEFLPINDTTGICPLVCKRWAALSKRRSLVVKSVEDRTRLHRGIRSLLVTGWLASLRSVLVCAAYYSPYLRSLTVHAGMPLTQEHLSELRHLPNLGHLDVFARAKIHDAQFTSVVRRLKSVVFNESVTPDLLRNLAGDCRLDEIHMYGRALHYHRRNLRAVIQLRADHIRHLTLRCRELTDTAYKAIGECPNLISLRLYSCWLMTAKGALYITKSLQLRCLHVTGARLVRSQAMGAFIELLPLSVDELVLSTSWFGDEHVPLLSTRLPSLKTLELWKCKLTTDGILKLAATLPLLHTLDLDLFLSPDHLSLLQVHLSLRMLRCLLAKASGDSSEPAFTNKKACHENSKDIKHTVTSEKSSKYRSIPISRKWLEVVPTDARYPRKYFRSGGEGFRGSLFYYWTRDRELTPLPTDSRPTLDDEDDMFY